VTDITQVTSKEEITPDPGPARDRAFWAAEAKRCGSDWAGVFGLHLAVLHRLRGEHDESRNSLLARADEPVAACARRRQPVRSTPDSTIEAVMVAVRERGTAALEEPAIQRCLAQLNDEQIIEVGARLRRLKAEIAPAWTADQVASLIQTRERLK
jgi:hypothetical protein